MDDFLLYSSYAAYLAGFWFGLHYVPYTACRMGTLGVLYGRLAFDKLQRERKNGDQERA